MRRLPLALGQAVYVVLSASIYVWLMPDVSALVLSLLFVYWPFALLRVHRPLRGWAAPVVICVQTGLLLWSRRYLALVPQLADSPALSHAVVIVGVSYIILRQVELVLWVDAEPETNVGFMPYTAFTVGLFTLLAGPIVTYHAFQRGFGNRRAESLRDLALTLNRLVNGYLKVSLFSPFLYELSSLSNLEQQGRSLGAWVAFLYLYPCYIYLNFSGYCDVVIAFGKLAHIHLPENFNHPFLATNIQDYWQRWHITFSKWIRAHIFFPLMRAGHSLGAVKTPLALFLTFVIVGLWHGTDPGFAVFGVLHGLGVLAVGPYQAFLRKVLGDDGLEAYESSRVLLWFRRAACYQYLCLTMLFFERPLAQMWKLLP